MPALDVVIGVVVRDGKVLIGRRRTGQTFAGCWEFPGGKLEPGESPEACLRRELHEELGLAVHPFDRLPSLTHPGPPLAVTLHPFLCEAEGTPAPLACEELTWVAPHDLLKYAFPPANGDLLEAVIQRLTSPRPPTSWNVRPLP